MLSPSSKSCANGCVALVNCVWCTRKIVASRRCIAAIRNYCTNTLRTVCQSIFTNGGTPWRVINVRLHATGRLQSTHG